MNQSPIFFKYKEYGLYPLLAGYNNDAGRDLLLPARVVVPPFDYVKVPLGISVKLPEPRNDFEVPMLKLEARSSTVENFHVLALPGIVDYGYNGELMAVLVNFTPTEKELPVLARTHQAVLYWCAKQPSNDKERNNNGFGST